MSRLLVAGSRNRHPSTDELDHCAEMLQYALDGFGIVVVHGNANGADKRGGAWAKARGWPEDIFEPDLEELGKQAGYLRNIAMVESGVDAAIIFWDGVSKGTKHTLSLIEGIPRVVVVR